MARASCGEIKNFIDLVREHGDQKFRDIPNPDQANIRSFANSHRGLFSRRFPNRVRFAQETWWLEVSLDVNNLIDSPQNAFLADDPDDPYTCSSCP